MNITLKTRRDFPFNRYETFHVRDGNGNVAETWTHVRKEDYGKHHELHT